MHHHAAAGPAYDAAIEATGAAAADGNGEEAFEHACRTVGTTRQVLSLITNPMDDENLPEKVDREIDMADGSKWTYPVSEGVVSLQTTRDTGYQAYIMVQNELTRAFNEVRDDVAQRKFGAKFSELNEDQRNAVSKAVPLKISEAEPRNIKK